MLSGTPECYPVSRGVTYVLIQYAKLFYVRVSFIMVFMLGKGFLLEGAIPRGEVVSEEDMPIVVLRPSTSVVQGGAGRTRKA